MNQPMRNTLHDMKEVAKEKLHIGKDVVRHEAPQLPVAPY